MKHLIPHNQVPALMLAGNAELVFENKETGKYRSYRIKKSKSIERWFVTFPIYPSILIGWISKDKEIFHTSSVRGIEEDADTFRYLYSHLLAGTLPGVMQVFHTGRCCACYRKLTTPESIADGIGPECKKRNS